jgi:sulfatase modifying factor 1
MKIRTTFFCLAFFSHFVFAQKSDYVTSKSISKKSLPGLVYIPAKTFSSLVHIGSDSVSNYSSRITSVSSFYMSSTEVTNKEYRAFVFYVRDSIAHVLLGHQRPDHTIDWSKNIDWNDKVLDEMMTAPQETLYGRQDIDPDKLVMQIDFFGQQLVIPVYPDTLVWIKDFHDSFNEPLVRKYFSHPDFNKYPVVGVSQKQAIAFCQWKTKQLNIGLTVRLPTQAEWEAAGSGEKSKKEKEKPNKNYDCNYGPMAGPGGTLAKGYKEDGFFYTAPVKSYAAGDYGLYDMKGNVSEWTLTSIDEIMNVEVRKGKERKLFIVKGGAWNSSVFYLQPGVCQFYGPDEKNSWTGFRYVVTKTEK